jgi:hypothetical protein
MYYVKNILQYVLGKNILQDVLCKYISQNVLCKKYLTGCTM